MFGTRVKTFQKKLDEHKATLSSPIPSPDINAPSPSPDSDIDLPGDTDSKVLPATEGIYNENIILNTFCFMDSFSSSHHCL